MLQGEGDRAGLFVLARGGQSLRKVTGQQVEQGTVLGADVTRRIELDDDRGGPAGAERRRDEHRVVFGSGSRDRRSRAVTGGIECPTGFAAPAIVDRRVGPTDQERIGGVPVPLGDDDALRREHLSKLCGCGGEQGVARRRGGQRGREARQRRVALAPQALGRDLQRRPDPQLLTGVRIGHPGEGADDPHRVPVVVAQRHRDPATTVILPFTIRQFVARPSLRVGCRRLHPGLRPRIGQTGGVIAEEFEERVVRFDDRAGIVGDEQALLHRFDQRAAKLRFPVTESRHLEVGPDPRHQLDR